MPERANSENMFVMKSIVEIGQYKCVLSSTEIRKSIYSLVDTCELVLPVNCHLLDKTDGTIIKDREQKIKYGDKVVVKLGYDDDINIVFEGFVVGVEKTIPLKVQCEGYSFLLRDKIIKKAYENATILNILTDVIGYESIDGYAVDAEIEDVFFNNVTSFKALQWLKEQLQCDVFFKGKTLYCVPSLKYLEQKEPIKLKLGWNTIKDNELQNDERAKLVNVVMVEHSKNGLIKKTKYTNDKYDTTMEVRIREGLPMWFVDDVREKIQNRVDYRGYKGEITLFLTPFIDKGDIVQIEDERYPERGGKYYVYGVKTTYGENGGRQIISIGVMPK